MVVAQGLLYDRRPRTRALRKRIARASYGIIVEEPQSSASALRKIIKQYPSKDVPAPDRIRWLVKSGETIQVDKPITLSLTKRLEKSDQRKWTEKIIWLMGDSSTLPENVEDGEYDMPGTKPCFFANQPKHWRRERKSFSTSTSKSAKARS